MSETIYLLYFLLASAAVASVKNFSFCEDPQHRLCIPVQITREYNEAGLDP